jgi:hypothetical protein
VGVTVHRAPTSRAHSTPTPGSRQRQPAPARIQRCRAFTFQPDSLSLTRHSASRPRGVGEHRARRGSRDPRRPERPAVDGDTIRKISGLPDSKNFIGCAVPQCASARSGRVVVYNARLRLRRFVTGSIKYIIDVTNTSNLFNTHVRHGITHCVVVYSNMRDWRPISYTNRARRMRGTMNPFTRDQRRQGGTHAAATRPRAPGRQRECLEWYRGTQARGDASAADGRAEGTLHRGT